MQAREVLLGYGKVGDFGRFLMESHLPCRRGDRFVVNTARGVELGSYLCEAGEGHRHVLRATAVGQVLRKATADDGRLAEQVAAQAGQLFAVARQTAAEFSLSLQVLDAEVCLDGQVAVLYFVRGPDCSPEPWLEALESRCALRILLQDLALPELNDPALPLSSCGSGGCGSDGGCGSCSSGGCTHCGQSSAPAPASAANDHPHGARVPLYSSP